jgi:excisionase family DNA binding protein
MCEESRSRATLAIAAALIGLAATKTDHEATLPQSDPLIDASTLADRLGVEVSWVRTKQRLGRIPGHKLGRYVRFRESEVQAALEKWRAA